LSFDGPIAAQGCSEFTAAAAASSPSAAAAAISSLLLDGRTKAFVTAAAELVVASTNADSSVLFACIGIDTDLMVTDTWTAKGPNAGGSLDAEVTEACTQAAAAISAALAAGSGACGLAVSGGQCVVDASAQTFYEGGCAATGSCQPGSITSRCPPADLAGQCSGTCDPNGTCEGTASVSANCQGSCAGTCTGTCSTATGSPVFCGGTCMGTCDGDCKLAAGAMFSCGANVPCTGGCSVPLTNPQCEAKLAPPSCPLDANCEASCQSVGELQATCEIPTVTLQCQGTVPATLVAVAKTIAKNLPPLVMGARAQGKLALDAAMATATEGVNEASNLGSLGGKALACTVAAVKVTASASASINVSVMASASVTTAAGG